MGIGSLISIFGLSWMFVVIFMPKAILLWGKSSLVPITNGLGGS